MYTTKIPFLLNLGVMFAKYYPLMPVNVPRYFPDAEMLNLELCDKVSEPVIGKGYT